MGPIISFTDLVNNLDIYNSQLKDLKCITFEQPNIDHIEIEKDLEEVVKLTEDILMTFIDSKFISKELSEVNHFFTSPGLFYNSTDKNMINLPVSIRHQMLELQAQQAIIGKGHPEWAIGQYVEALWPRYSHHYLSKIIAVTKDHHFLIEFIDYKDQEILRKNNVKKIKKNVIEGYSPSSTLRNNQANEDIFLSLDIPKKLLIKEGDNRSTIQKKQKLLKNYKKQKRFAEMDIIHKLKIEHWRTFILNKCYKVNYIKKAPLSK